MSAGRNPAYELRIPLALRDRLGADASFALADYTDDRIDAAIERFRQEQVLLRSELRADMANLRADLIKWMFTFWIGQAAVTVGLILAIR